MPADPRRVSIFGPYLRFLLTAAPNITLDERAHIGRSIAAECSQFYVGTSAPKSAVSAQARHTPLQDRGDLIFIEKGFQLRFDGAFVCARL